jgi:hypothetical protein
MSSRGFGFLLGSGICVAFLAIYLGLIWVPPEDHYSYSEADDSAFWVGLWLATPVAGYLAAFVAIVRRSTRRVGQGMLIGLTLLLPVVVAVGFGITVSNSI